VSEGLAGINGSTQAGRRQAALSPDSAPVDARTLPELHHFVAQFARLLQYVGLDNLPNGDWQAFFTDGLSFVLAEMLCFDAAAELREVAHIVHQEVESRRRDRVMLKRIFELYKRINTWLLRTRKIGMATPRGIPAALTLEQLVKQQLASLYQAVSCHQHQAHAWQVLQQAYFKTISSSDQAYLTLLWNATLNDEMGDFDSTPSDLNAAHLSFVHCIAASQPAIQHYFDDSLQQSIGHQPHTSLMTAFLRIFQHAQNNANALTGRHLDFYYRTILQLHERAALPDKAFVNFQASPDCPGSLIPAGTQLRAGKLPNGQDLIYAMDFDLVVNQDKLASLKTIHASLQAMGPYQPAGAMRVARLYAAPQADSQDGLGKPLSRPELGWPTFGRAWDHNPRVIDSAPLAEIGVMMTSPMLSLRGGRRVVRLRFQYAQKPASMPPTQLGAPPSGSWPAFADVAQCYHDAIGDSYDGITRLSQDALLWQAMAESCQVWLTTQAGWLQAPRVAVRTNMTQAWIEILVLLPATFPAVLPGPVTPQEAGNGSPWPRLKLLLAPTARVYPYSFIQQLSLTGISLRASVARLNPIAVSGSQGPINTASPFPIFGSVPILGSYLALNDPELAGKPIVRAALQVDWFNLPRAPADLAEHYQGYAPPPIYNNSFRVRFQICRQGQWTVVGGDSRPLFTDPDKGPPGPPDPTGQAIQPGLSLQTSPRFDLSSSDSIKRPWEGVRMELVAPTGAFGHQLYPQVLAASVLQTAATTYSEALASMLNRLIPKPWFKSLLPARPKSPKSPRPPAQAQAQPLPPFVPLAKHIALNYVATAPLQAVETTPLLAKSMPCFYQLGPFGYQAAQIEGFTLLDGIDRAGQLYIGLQNLTPGHMVSLLFGMRETVARQRAVKRDWPGGGNACVPAPAVEWYYLQTNQWQRFANHDLISDSTNGLTESGIVRLQTGAHSLNSDNTLMPAGLFWLAAVVDDPQMRSHTLYASTQAASVTQLLAQSQPLASGPLPLGSIQDFVSKPAGIQTVNQPLPTLGGQSTEVAGDFPVRVSERLRHKQRAWRALDFEQIALDTFPSILQAKCIVPSSGGSSQYVSDSVPPGSVGLVVVPRPPNNAQHAPRPTVTAGILAQIKSYVLQHSAATFRNLQVLSPQYEEIKICVQVVMKTDGDYAYYERRLNDAISDWLAPWRRDRTIPLPIGGNASNINDLNVFIANHECVAQVIALEPALHMFEKNGKRQTRWLRQDDPLIPSSPWSVLVPAARHYITTTAQPYGIGQMAVGQDVMILPNPPAEDPKQAATAAPINRRYALYLPVLDVVQSQPGFNRRGGK